MERRTFSTTIFFLWIPTILHCNISKNCRGESSAIFSPDVFLQRDFRYFRILVVFKNSKKYIIQLKNDQISFSLSSNEYSERLQVVFNGLLILVSFFIIIFRMSPKQKFSSIIQPFLIIFAGTHKPQKLRFFQISKSTAISDQSGTNI